MYNKGGHPVVLSLLPSDRSSINPGMILSLPLPALDLRRRALDGVTSASQT